MNKQILFFGILFFGVWISLGAQSRVDLQKHIENTIYYDAKVRFQETPGFIIGVLIGDSTYVYSYGSQSKTDEVPITDSTLFELGGASKVFSASLLELLVQEGEMHYDSTLATYLGNEKINTPSLFDVVTHHGGLPRMPQDFGAFELDINNPYAHYTKSDLKQFYQKYSFLKQTSTYEYSHLSYALLELAMEQQIGFSFEKALQQYILSPYSMTDTRLGFGKSQQQLAQGYSMIGEEVAPWSTPACHAAIGVQSSMRDLLQWIRIQIQTDTFDGLHQKDKPTLVDKNSYAAKGWHVIAPKRYFDIIAHSGSTAGHRIFMAFIKESQTGVVILSNSKVGTNGLGYMILKSINNDFKKTTRQRKF